MFTWATDYSTCTATFACDNDSSHTEVLTATVTSATTDAKCTVDGETVYTATVTFEGTEYTATQTAAIPATGHNYEAVVTEPTCTERGYTTYTCTECADSYVSDYVDALGHNYELTGFTWSADYSTCTATFTCTEGDDTQTVDATVTSATTDAQCTTDGEIVYTATVTFEGTEYTDTQTEAISATGHSYELTGFTWADDLKSATVTFTCAICGDVQTVDATVKSVNKLGVVTRTATVEFENNTYTDTKTTGKSLLIVQASYKSVYEAIEKANALNADDYTNFENVTAAINAVNWNLNVLHQKTVNAYAEAIETAIANLVEVEITEETVTIDEPVEDTDTNTETDEEPEEPETESELEANPTTGVALVLVPMAVAAMGVVVNKRR